MTFWTEENVALLKQAVGNKKPAQIAREVFGGAVSRKAVKDKLRRLKIRPAPSFWTDERIAQLRQACADGMLAREIADNVFGGAVTRTAVIGKRHRLGIKDDRETISEKISRAKPSRRESHTGSRSPRPRRVKSVLTPPDPSLNCSLFDLTDKRCRNPVGEPAELRYCGAPVAHGSFCAHCASVFYDRTRSRKVNEYGIAA